LCEEFLYDIKGGLRPPSACGRRFAPSSAVMSASTEGVQLELAEAAGCTGRL
jgi:hypothetical protein